MSSDTPAVSVVIPTRNRAALLLETLESLRNQTSADWEAVVVDDHSTDNTSALVQEHYGNEPRVRLLIREGDIAGAPVCRNQGMYAAKGTYLIFLDSDDLLMPHCIAQRVQYIEAHPELDFAVFQGELFAEKPGDLGKPWNRFTDQPDLDRFLHMDVPWQTTGPIWTRRGLKALSGWDESLMCWQDFDIHIRAVINSLKYTKVDSADYLVRRSPGGNDNIHAQNSTPAHLKTRLRLMRKLTNELRAKGLYDQQARYNLTYAFFWIAREWIYRRQDRVQACLAWKECLEEGVIDPVRFHEGIIGLKYMEGRRGLTPLFGAYTRHRWK